MTDRLRAPIGVDHESPRAVFHRNSERGELVCFFSDSADLARVAAYALRMISLPGLEAHGESGFGRDSEGNLVTFLTGPDGAVVALQPTEDGAGRVRRGLLRAFEDMSPAGRGIYYSVLNGGVLDDDYSGSPLVNIINSSSVVPIREVPGFEHV